MNQAIKVNIAAAGALLLIVSACFAGGCGAPAPTTTDLAPVSTAAGAVTTSSAGAGETTASAGAPSTVPSVSVAAGVTLDQARSAEFTVPYEEDMVTFTLANGAAPSGQSSPGSPRTVQVQAAMSDLVAFGDIDGDGADDAVIAVGVGQGANSDTVMEGSAHITQYIVALLSNGGRPAQGGYHLIGAGATVADMSIDHGAISVAAFVPASEEPAGPPAALVTAGLRLPLDPSNTRELLHVSQTSETPAGEIRAIEITSPASGTTVGVPCVITGTITIAPFENNLVLSAYTADMTERAVTPVTVEAPGLGAPGTFRVTLTLSPPGTTGLVFVTIADRSAVDGSILAMASVQLVVK